MEIFTALRLLLEHGPGRLLVAYSGGVDSHVLLHLLVKHRQQLAGRALAAVYVDHGLQSASTEWAEHCRQVCRELGVQLICLSVDAQAAAGESPEAAARRARYSALEGLVGEGDALLVAHHRDDQAETLLLQLLRGAGPRGLAAMPASAPLGKGRLLRPLLELERVQILDYARAHGLCWVDDPSNADKDLDRNYLRHEILPSLKSRWPGMSRTLARSARRCAESSALNDELAENDLLPIISKRCLSVPDLALLTAPRQRNALRYWLRSLDLPSPSEAQLERVLSDVIATPRDRQPCVQWPGAQMRRYRDGLYAMAPLPPFDPTRVWSWSPPSVPLLIPGVGRLELRRVQGRGLRCDVLRQGALTVRFRQSGERFRPRGRRHTQALKKLMQEAGIPPWERQRLPLLYVDEELVTVAGLAEGARFVAPPEEQGWVLVWTSLQ